MTHLEDEPERDSEQCGAAANQDTELAQAGTIHPNDSPFVEDATAGNEGVKADAFDRLDELIIKPGSRWSISMLVWLSIPINVTRSLGAYIMPNMCMPMCILIGTIGKPTPVPGATCAVERLSSPIRLPSMLMNM
jgi:hypothetical protein